MEAVWKDIPGWEGLYEASIWGHIRSKKNNIALKQFVNSYYCCVNLCSGKTRRKYPVHRLITAAFLGACPDGLQVNHKNLNKLDNRLSNLEYCTAKENIRHAVRNGVQIGCVGEKHWNAKLTDDNVREIRKYRGGKVLSYREVGKKYGINRSQVKAIMYGRAWKHVS